MPPLSLEERLMHVAEAKRRTGSAVPWLSDTMENVAKRAFGGTTSSAFVFDREGHLVAKRLWSDPVALRADLADLVSVDEPEAPVSALAPGREEKREERRTGIVARIDVPWAMRPLETTPVERGASPFYVKLRAEAEEALLRTGHGRLYLGFFIDPLYEVHWNNDVSPIRFELDLPQGVTAAPDSGTGPDVDVESDSDPREFLIDVDGWQDDVRVTARVHYFACDDRETFCVPVTQSHEISPTGDPDGGRRLTGAMGARLQRLLERDADGDGRIGREELPEPMREGFDRLDVDANDLIDEDELKRIALSQREGRNGPTGMTRRLMELDADGDGRLHRDEIPPAMEHLIASFDRLDRNGDGYIDARELEEMTRPDYRRRLR